MRGILLTLLVWVSLLGKAESLSVAYDVASPSAVEWREFDKEKIEAFKSDSDFDYNVDPQVKKNFFYNFINSIIKWLTGYDLGALFPDGGLVYYLVKWGTYALITVALIFVVIQLVKMQSTGMVRGRKSQVINHEVTVEDIHTIDFSKSIQEALDNGNYRLAVRLYYLHALKVLADGGQLIWQPWKTNFDYQNELKSDRLKPHFQVLGYYFEFIWYGNFEVSEAILDEVKGSFSAVQQTTS